MFQDNKGDSTRLLKATVFATIFRSSGSHLYTLMLELLALPLAARVFAGEYTLFTDWFRDIQQVTWLAMEFRILLISR